MKRKCAIMEMTHCSGSLVTNLCQCGLLGNWKVEECRVLRQNWDSKPSHNEGVAVDICLVDIHKMELPRKRGVN
jgi:hypothetical protein